MVSIIWGTSFSLKAKPQRLAKSYDTFLPRCDRAERLPRCSNRLTRPSSSRGYDGENAGATVAIRREDRQKLPAATLRRLPAPCDSGNLKKPIWRQTASLSRLPKTVTATCVPLPTETERQGPKTPRAQFNQPNSNPIIQLEWWVWIESHNSADGAGSLYWVGAARGRIVRPSPQDSVGARLITEQGRHGGERFILQSESIARP